MGFSINPFEFGRLLLGARGPACPLSLRRQRLLNHLLVHGMSMEQLEQLIPGAAHFRGILSSAHTFSLIWEWELHSGTATPGEHFRDTGICSLVCPRTISSLIKVLILFMDSSVTVSCS